MRLSDSKFRRETQAINNYSKDKIEEVALQWIHNKRDREITLERLINGFHYDYISEKYDLSTTRIKEIIHDGVHKVAEHIN